MKRKKVPFGVSVSVLLLLLLIGASLLAERLAPHDPTYVDLMHKFEPMSREYPLGTDDFGRCIFSRCLYAVRTSVGIAFLIELLSVVIGSLIGMFSAYVGGVFDRLINVISEAFLSFPSMILIMLIVAFLGPKTQNIIIAMMLVNWIWYTRITRGMTLAIREQTYIQAARVCGASTPVIIFRHITPRIVTQMIAQFTLSLGGVILSLAGFSFLGIGVQRPTPELGVMINDGCSQIRTNFMVLFWPSLLLFLVVLSFNVIGDYLSDQLRGGRQS